MWGPIRVFDEREEDLIHRTTLRILDEVGLIVESQEILERLAETGGRIDSDAMRVTFAPEFTEAFIAESEDFDWLAGKPDLDPCSEPPVLYTVWGNFCNSFIIAAGQSP